MIENKVTLYIYDISNGMAASFGQMIVGKHVEAIYHTSLVVFNKEFYFSGGICYDPVGTTAFGRPIKTMDMGTTELTVQDLFEYLQAVKDKYSFSTYHVFENNCNHFTNDICEFLTGSSLPNHILHQAKEYRESPIGKFIEGMQVNLNNNHDNYNISYNGFTNQNQPNQSFQQVQSTPQGNANHSVREIKDVLGFMEIVQDNKKVIVDFYANWCGPCKKIKPVYQILSEQYKGKIVFCEVNVDLNQDLVANVKVNAMPTFIVYQDGKEVERIQGANEGKIREALEKLNKA